MNHLTDGHQTYSSSSQDVHRHYRPNPAHSQALVGPNQLAAAREARPVEYPPTGYITCDTGMFAGRTIRAEAHEVQKANVGRKYVFFRRGLGATRPQPLPLLKLKFFEDMLRPKIGVLSTHPQSQNCGYSTSETPGTVQPK